MSALTDPPASSTDSAAATASDKSDAPIAGRRARFARQLDAGELWSIRNQASQQPSSAGADATAAPNAATVPIPASLTRSASAGLVPSRNAIISPPRRPPPTENGNSGPSLAAPARGRNRNESNAYGVRPADEYKTVLQSAIPLQAGKGAPDQVQIEEDKDDEVDDIEALGAEFWSIEKIEVDLKEHRDRIASTLQARAWLCWFPSSDESPFCR